MGYGTPESMPPERFRDVVRGQSDKWARLIKAANIQLE